MQTTSMVRDLPAHYTERMAAQNQHYVPKFVLREFLSGDSGERVQVYDKHADKVFVTSIKNIMAERRFNEFAMGERFIASFEPIACGAEEQVLPAYREVLQSRRLSDAPEQKAGLAMFLAFQFLRTKAHRDQWQVMEDEIVKLVEGSGGKMQDVQGWEAWQPATEDSLKQEHLMSIQGQLGEVAHLLAAKDFVLAEPYPGTSFYLGDNPVVRANSVDHGLYGKLGLACEGIEIYMPLASDLLLCAWCPSILDQIRASLENGRRDAQAQALRRVMSGSMDAAAMKRSMDDFELRVRDQADLLSRAAHGHPVNSAASNMDYYNGLQTTWAYRYVISQDGDFDFARRVNRENPQLRRGRRMQVG